MQSGKLNVVLDAFWGSCGKGKVCDWLASMYTATDLISGNMPNAGHTVVRYDQSVVAKVLPSAAFFNPNTRIWLAPSTGFFPERLHEEADRVQNRDVLIHDRAFTVSVQDKHLESLHMVGIASTMQGSAYAMIQKIKRNRPQTMFCNLPDNDIKVPGDIWRTELVDRIEQGTALYEVSQGWGLSIDHGTHYPQCTSRNCGTARAIDDSACPPRLLGDVVAVIRPYPIRVGNIDNGHSGGWASDNVEVTWDHVKRESGLTEDLAEKERTTVTKRIRRVSTFSYELLYGCVRHNSVNQIFLNFAQYIDASIAGKRGRIHDAPPSVRMFINAIEDMCEVPVIAIGTGADTFDVMVK